MAPPFKKKSNNPTDAAASSSSATLTAVKPMTSSFRNSKMFEDKAKFCFCHNGEECRCDLETTQATLGLTPDEFKSLDIGQVFALEKSVFMKELNVIACEPCREAILDLFESGDSQFNWLLCVRSPSVETLNTPGGTTSALTSTTSKKKSSSGKKKQPIKDEGDRDDAAVTTNGASAVRPEAAAILKCLGSSKGKRGMVFEFSIENIFPSLELAEKKLKLQCLNESSPRIISDDDANEEFDEASTRASLLESGLQPMPGRMQLHASERDEESHQANYCKSVGRGIPKSLFRRGQGSTVLTNSMLAWSRRVTDLQTQCQLLRQSEAAMAVMMRDFGMSAVNDYMDNPIGTSQRLKRDGVDKFMIGKFFIDHQDEFIDAMKNSMNLNCTLSKSLDAVHISSACAMLNATLDGDQLYGTTQVIEMLGPMDELSTGYIYESFVIVRNSTVRGTMRANTLFELLDNACKSAKNRGDNVTGSSSKKGDGTSAWPLSCKSLLSAAYFLMTAYSCVSKINKRLIDATVSTCNLMDNPVFWREIRCAAAASKVEGSAYLDVELLSPSFRMPRFALASTWLKKFVEEALLNPDALMSKVFVTENIGVLSQIQLDFASLSILHDAGTGDKGSGAQQGKVNAGMTGKGKVSAGADKNKHASSAPPATHAWVESSSKRANSLSAEFIADFEKQVIGPCQDTLFAMEATNEKQPFRSDFLKEPLKSAVVQLFSLLNLEKSQIAFLDQKDPQKPDVAFKVEYTVKSVILKDGLPLTPPSMRRFEKNVRVVTDLYCKIIASRNFVSKLTSLNKKYHKVVEKPENAILALQETLNALTLVLVFTFEMRILKLVQTRNHVWGCARCRISGDEDAKAMAVCKAASRGREVCDRILPQMVKSFASEAMLLLDVKTEENKQEALKKKKEEEKRKVDEAKRAREQVLAAERAAEEERIIAERVKRKEEEEAEDRKVEEERNRERDFRNKLQEDDRKRRESERREQEAEIKRTAAVAREAEEAAKSARLKEERDMPPWICGRCTMENSGADQKCPVCEMERGATVVPEAESTTMNVPDLNRARAGLAIRAPTDAFIGSAVALTTTTARPANRAAAANIRGLSNNAGENSCFLNVVVQSLYHLKPFSDVFGTAPHNCPLKVQGGPQSSCLVCALHMTFSGLSKSSDSLVSSEDMRNAMTGAFKLGAMEDAGEALVCVLETLHDAISIKLVTAAGAPKLADASSCDCHVHHTFASLYLEGVDCELCKKNARANKFDKNKFPNQYRTLKSYGIVQVQEYASFIRYVPAALIVVLDGKFQERLYNALHVEPRSCPVCDSPGLEIERTIRRCASVYTVGVVWSTNSVPPDEIRAFLEAVAEYIDVNVVENTHGSPAKQRPLAWARLRGMMCYYGSHYAAYFRPDAVNEAQATWFNFDDSSVNLVGSTWKDVAKACLSNRFQPIALFYESIPSLEVDDLNVALNGVTFA